MTTADILVGLDRTEFDQDLDEADESAARAIRNITTNIRRTAEIGLFFAEAAGVAIDQILQLYIEAGLRAIEFAVALTTTEFATLGPFAAGKLVAQGAAVALMFAQINALRKQKTENARRIGLATSGLRALTF